MTKVSLAEQETILLKCKSDDFVSISTSDSADIRLMARLGIEPYSSQGHCWQYRVPENWFRRTSKGWIVAPPRVVSEEHSFIFVDQIRLSCVLVEFIYFYCRELDLSK